MAYVRPYAILYRYDLANDVVFVLRVLHSKRNITRALLRGEPNAAAKGKRGSWLIDRPGLAPSFEMRGGRRRASCEEARLSDNKV